MMTANTVLLQRHVSKNVTTTLSIKVADVATCSTLSGSLCSKACLEIVFASFYPPQCFKVYALTFLERISL